jgi:O-antigen ligase
LILLGSTLSHETPRKGRFAFALLFGVLGCLALLGGWLAPNHYPPWTSFHNEASTFAALVAFCVATVASQKALTFPKAPLVFLALTVLVWLQWASGQIMFTGDAIVSSLYLVGFGLAWWLGANSISTSRNSDALVSLLALLLVIGAALSILVAVLQWQRLESTWGIFAAGRGPTMRPFGNLAQPNHLATLALMGVAFSCVLYVQGHLKKWQVIGLVAYLSFGVILTESRTGMLGAFVLGVFFLWCGKRSWGLGGWKVIALWWLALLILAFLWAPLNEAMLLQPARDAAMTQDDARMVMWKQSIAAIGHSPWLGYGWRQTVVGQKIGADTVMGSLATDYAHNAVLDILLWVGIPLGTLLLVLAGGWLIKTARRVDCPLQCLMFASALPFFVHSMFEFPFAYSYFLFPVGWTLGALSARLDICVTEKNVENPWRHWISASFLFVFATLCVLVAQEYFEAEEDYRVMRFELRRLGSTPIHYAAPQLVLLTQLDETLKVGRMVPYPGMSARDIERLRIANASQAWATLHLSYAVALALNGQPEEATYQLRNLRALYGPETYKQVSELFLRVQAKQYPQLAVVKLP